MEKAPPTPTAMIIFNVALMVVGVAVLTRPDQPTGWVYYVALFLFGFGGIGLGMQLGKLP